MNFLECVECWTKSPDMVELENGYTCTKCASEMAIDKGSGKNECSKKKEVKNVR